MTRENNRRRYYCQTKASTQQRELGCALADALKNAVPDDSDNIAIRHDWLVRMKKQLILSDPATRVRFGCASFQLFYCSRSLIWAPWQHPKHLNHVFRVHQNWKWHHDNDNAAVPLQVIWVAWNGQRCVAIFIIAYRFLASMMNQFYRNCRVSCVVNTVMITRRIPEMLTSFISSIIFVHLFFNRLLLHPMRVKMNLKQRKRKCHLLNRGLR